MPKISILIPVYNVEKYLRECIESAINQTEKDLEIVCVDDASTDGSYSILCEYEKKDSRIKVLKHDENQGLCQTRKDAVKVAEGKYILFLDSDDYISLNTCERLFEVMEEGKYDFVQFGAEVLSGENVSDELLKWVDNFMNPENTTLVSGNILRGCFVEHRFNCNLVNKIWRKELCKKGFSEILDGKYVSAEDRYALFILSYYANSVGIIKDKFYHYRLGVGVTGGNVLDIGRFESRCKGVQIVKNIQKFLTQQGKKEEYRKEFFDFKKEILLDCIDCCFMKIKEERTEEAISILLKYWELKDVISLIGSNYFEKQSLILKRTHKRGKTAIYYRYIGYREMDRVLLRYKRYFEDKGIKLLLITDDNSPEKKNIYLGCPLEHIFSAEKANWSDYQYRSNEMLKVLQDNNVSELLYLSPTSHVAALDEVTVKLSGCTFEMCMDEYGVDELNKIKRQPKLYFLKQVMNKIKRGE